MSNWTRRGMHGEVQALGLVDHGPQHHREEDPQTPVDPRAQRHKEDGQQ
eukprot:gene29853-39614_t